MLSSAVTQIVKVTGDKSSREQDRVATEEPLEIRLNYLASKGRTTKSLSVTMRTPGNDSELATGFLYTEGIITAAADVLQIENIDARNGNVVKVSLADGVIPDIGKLERNFYTTSSCGVCGKSSIEAVRVACDIIDRKDNIRIAPELLYNLPGKLRQQQDVFEQTGGLHAVALFDLQGQLLILREDAGRHNAADKLIGAALMAGTLPLDNHILLLSGRSSFELVQKAAMAGVKIIAAVGAPSSLAVQMANDWGITLVGFLRDQRFNIYSAPERIITN
ncbi:MAG: formate dehydrogenase accessory sulfurtransferase FdhD [Taibaiella sp.]|nr:formate dehydrogenase accessory sulfurtransferase FdhD [Taibaiella sp.]